MDTRATRDRGNVLPLVLIMSVVLSLVVVALVTYITAGLRYGQVVEDRADRLAAADGGLRYGIERLQLSSYSACTSGLGTAGYTVPFPQDINDSQVEVTCTRTAGEIADIQGWALVVTGAGVPDGQALLSTQAGGGLQKLLGGPVWVTDPTRMDLKAPLTLENGDVWYHGQCSGPAPTLPSGLDFVPAFRGLSCVDSPWDQAFAPPPVAVPAGPVDPPPDTTTFPGCSVFAPGRYTTMPAFTDQNYLRSGEYVIQDVSLDLKQAKVVAGWADVDRFGDQQFLDVPACAAAIDADRSSGSAAGATLYLSGSSRIRIENQGALEVQRRQQGAGVVSVHALDGAVAGYGASSLGWNDEIIVTQGGATSDLILHGQVWAPRARITFGTVASRANGQLLGGGVFARVHLQASASASGFVIRVEPSPMTYRLVVRSTATKHDRSTAVVAVVEVDDLGATAVNSWRVVD